MVPIISVYFLMFFFFCVPLSMLPGSTVTRHLKYVLGTSREVVVYLLVDTLYLNKY